MFKYLNWFLVGSALASAPLVFAADRAAPINDQVREGILREIAKSYIGCRVELTGRIAWTDGRVPTRADQITILGDSGSGDLRFMVRSGSEMIDGTVPFAAREKSYVALRRIHPGERISKDSFVVQDIDVALGQAHELRGLILPTEMDLGTLEARQTILEGQSLLSNQVERVPDVRKGDVVRLRLISGSVVLSTMGIASEPAYLDSQVRVITQKSKRELAGILERDGVVEVHL